MPYRFEVRLMNNPGALPGRLLTYLEMTEVSFSSALNRAGTLRGRAIKPILDTQLLDLPYPSFEPGTSALWVWREPPIGETGTDPTYVWAGVIWDVNGDTESNIIDISAEEFTGVYDRLRLTTDFAGNNVNRGAIDLVGDLISIVVGGATQLNMLLDKQPASATGPIVRPRWFEFEDRMVGDLIKTLSSQGFGTGQHFEWQQVIHHRTIVGSPLYQTRAYFTIWENGAGVTRTWPTIEAGKNTINNARKIEFTYSARQTATRLKVKGFGEGASQLKSTVLSPYGFNRFLMVFDAVQEDQELRSQTAVDNTANQMITGCGLPIPHFNASIPVDQINFPINSVNLGDTLAVRVDDGYMKYRGYLRIVGLGFRVVGNAYEEYVLELTADANSLIDPPP